ncbi:MAG: FAD-binding oxidoreductase [Rudaea sp.]|uniref:FAD-binding oxidoreductase n=1 Tax=unclassified Rudaea TaxID=2627037 RepID=UPI0010F9D031|nr:MULTISPECIES: FAD-binding oxidoreductase [unclassified Rudaea]MBN8887169.1 FAD-binding oxidoreductase [Rudaea sp.]
MPAVGTSWGRYPRAKQTVAPLHWRDEGLPDAEGSVLAYGNGRSYGDVCLNDGNTLLHTRGLDRYIAFDPASGILRCEAGVLFADILDFAVPQGWFLPVTPGTRYITVGGAIANDVHGKNHHVAGTFGEHLLRFELLRSDGRRLECSADENADLYAATIGGLGLTGVIVWAEFRLQRIASPWMAQETRRFGNLAEFFSLSAQSERDYAYTVAWIDCTARGDRFGRGIFYSANHAPANAAIAAPRQRRLSVPFTPPISLINGLSLSAFNELYFRRAHEGHEIVHYEPYFYPLDAIGEWNRIYGPRGFLQYQCVVPPAAAETATAELLRTIAASGSGSFLAVLKVFADRPAAGILSFPRAGTTLALDFPNRGAATFALLDRLDEITAAAGGAVYPAKDARMNGARFRQYFPRWQEMRGAIDPKFSSGFWRRVME